MSEPEPPKAQLIPTGHWENGKFISPEGWPEGAGWVVKNEDGSIAQWGPASDLALIASTVIGQGPLPAPADAGFSVLGLPQPADEPSDG